MFVHEPVLLEEAVGALAVRPDGVYVDCTVGGGGHSARIAERLGPDGLLIALDQDDAALEAAARRLAPYRDRVRLVKRNFRHLAAVLAELGIARVQGVLFDLGVSSPQFDEAERGFSYRFDAPLDMRMDPERPITAADLVNTLTEAELAELLRRYGEERFAKAIAREMVRARARKPIETTGELVEIVKRAIPAPARRTGPHPARRTFQALRIAVNDELDALREGLEAAVAHLATGGRVAVITFHSLEDRICKQAFREWSRGCICPPGLPVCACGRRPLVRVLTKKPIVPSEDEVRRNPRARSAKLRVAERVGDASGQVEERGNHG
ncbi:16S rRNA (cytosine(1402)-N(4))-methyltransferase RsmH [Calditerricola satsumensis]|uniref:Ribosomal RNA small subunit methyltransferase H n=1 Tax=Calditerricola satsumensis TaxID=373054 RepID=A0A8J3B499_9BACI|nr:16S rRNA (cytosine(1402)-N(4))-methyltransferase RsmH [Calditerricola satsumensis]GGJ92382.1 ribosomal RNA small subunit methyltransferase H [Calditerricola satsumensis]